MARTKKTPEDLIQEQFGAHLFTDPNARARDRLTDDADPEVDTIREDDRSGFRGRKRADEPLDLATEAFPSRAGQELAGLLSHFEQFAKAYPERAREAAERINGIADIYRPLDTDRALGMSDATRITGLSVPRIKQLAAEGRLGEKQGSRWAFSEKELVELAASPRPSGRPKKISPRN